MPIIVNNVTAVQQTISSSQVVVNGTDIPWQESKIIENVKVIHHVEYSISCESTGATAAELKFSFQRDIGGGYEPVAGEVACYNLEPGRDERLKMNFKVPYYEGIYGFVPRYRLIAECVSGQAVLHRAEGRDALPSAVGKQEYEFAGEPEVITWVDKITASFGSTYVIKSDGTLWATGYNPYGQLGLGDTANRNVFTQVGASNDWAKVICAGDSHVFAIKNNGTLWVCGYNGYGQLGLGDTTDRNVFTQVGAGTDWEYISIGNGNNSFAIKNNGTLWATGRNNYGQLGLGDTAQRTSFAQVGSGTDWSRVKSAEGHTFAFKNDGSMWVCGYNYNGQLGLGHTDSRNVFVQHQGSGFIDAVPADYHTLLLKTDGTLWGCGDSQNGVLGDIPSNFRNVFPLRIGGASNWTKIAASISTSYAINSSGALYASGYNAYGQFGLGNNTSYFYAMTLTGFTANSNAASPGSGHTVVATDARTYHVTGRGTWGQLGLGNNNNRNTFIQILA